jgi:beta-apo-4'-carotenal oxygenase
MDEKEYSYSGELPAFAAESADAIPEIVRSVRSTFRVHKTKDIKYRLVQLRKFYWAMKDYQPKLLEALRRDMRKCAYEGMLSEVSYVQNDCLFASKHLEKWMKDEKLGTPDVPLHFSLMKARVRKEPLGAVLIIGTWNYPIQLLLTPFVGAIAAGCTAVLKPSEGAPNVAAVIKEMVESRLDTSAYRVVNGAVDQATALLDQKWDKIMFTGATEVGTIIAKKAAETLTPVLLELGGRNPAFVTRNAPDVKLAAKRILQSKCFNAGQLCLSENYAIVQKDVLNTFIEGLQQAFKEFFPEGAQASPDLSRIINKRHFDRLKKMIDDSKGQIVVGGKMDEKELFMEPTGILVDSLDDPVVANESFGPIFGIYPYNTLDEAINAMNRIDRTPLAESVFGNKNEIKKSESFLPCFPSEITPQNIC